MELLMKSISCNFQRITLLRKLLFLLLIIFFGGIVIWVIVHNYVKQQKESQIYLENIFCQ